MTKYKTTSDINGNIKHKNDDSDTESIDSCYYDDMLPVPTVSLATASLVTGVLSLLCYWSTQQADFTFDDNSAILGNKDILPHTPISHLLYNDFWGTKVTSNTSHKSYRPLVVLTFRLSYYLAGGFKPWYFHIVNIVLHTLNSVLLLRVFSLIFHGGYTKNFACPKASLLCGVLFAVHPIHTESVAATVGRADLLCTLFYILSFLCYVKHSHQNSSWIHYALALTFAFTAIFCKEQGITVLGICVAFDIICMLQINVKNFMHLSYNENDASKVIKRVAMTTLATILFLLFRMSIMGSRPPQFQEQDNPASFHENILVRITNYIYIYSINIWLLLTPWWLCFDWAMGCVPVIASLADVRLIAVLMFIVSTLSFAVKVITLLETHTGRVLAMALAFTVVPFLPAMNVFFRVGFVVAERNLYISSIGFILLFVTSLILICQHSIVQKMVKICLVFLIVLYVARSINRSDDWLNESNLFNSGVKVCPSNAKVHYNIGKTNQDADKKDLAIQNYLEAIRLFPKYDQPMNNLGNIYKERKMFVEAEEVLERAVKISPTFATAWMNLGSVKCELKMKEESNKCFQLATTHKRNYPDAYYNWGNTHLDFEEYDIALDKFKMALKLKPDHSHAWLNLILMLGTTGNLKELQWASNEVSKVLPNDRNIVHSLGNSFGKAGDLKAAEKYIKQTIQIDPNFGGAYGNLAVVYHRLKRYEEALPLYEKSLHLEPHSQYMKENYAKLKKTMGRR